jgi:hypothetical protein
MEIWPLNKKKSFNLRAVLKLILIILISLALTVIAIITIILIRDKPANYKGLKVFKLMLTSVDDLNTIIRLKKISRVFVKNSFIISFL